MTLEAKSEIGLYPKHTFTSRPRGPESSLRHIGNESRPGISVLPRHTEIW